LSGIELPDFAQGTTLLLSGKRQLEAASANDLYTRRVYTQQSGVENEEAAKVGKHSFTQVTLLITYVEASLSSYVARTAVRYAR
jgi:hypothetical protein